MKRIPKPIARLSLLTLCAGLPAALAQDVGSSADTAVERVPRGLPQFGGDGASSSAVCIYNNLAGDPKAAVPGLPGASFSPGTGTTHFDRPYGSPGGNWILSADTDLVTSMDEVLIVNGALAVQEGTPNAAYGAGENTGLIDQRLDIDDAGNFVFATATNGPTTANDYIVQVIGGVFSVAAVEGGPIPGLPGATYDDLLDSPVIANGVVGFRADGIDGGGVATTNDEILELGGVILAREGVTIPTGQVASEFWETFDTSDFFVTPDGQHWLVQGDITGGTSDDDVVAYDGAVVLQENVVIPGSGFANPIDLSGIVGVALDPGGNWYARGNNDVTEDDWVVRNGVVVATVGQPVTTGSVELWDDAVFLDCYFLHVGDSVGNYVIGGVTNSAVTTNGVLVLNGTDVICRESDPIDMDGNGQFDDDTFFNTFGNDDGFLSDSGTFYFVATFKNGAGTEIGQGFFSISQLIGTTTYCTAKSGLVCGIPAIGASGQASASATSGFVVSAGVALGNRSGILLYTDSGRATLPFSGGTLCLSPMNLRRTVAVNSGGTAGQCDGTFTIDMNAFGAGVLGGNPAVFLGAAGTQINAQFWGRDTVATGAFLSDGLEYVITP